MITRELEEHPERHNRYSVEGELLSMPFRY
jgi:hypothetical protein